MLHVLFLVLFFIGIGAAAYPAFGNWYTEQKRSVVLTEYEKALAKIEDADLTDAFKQAEIYNDALFTGETDEEERPDYGELLCTTEDGIMGYVEIPSIQIRLADLSRLHRKRAQQRRRAPTELFSARRRKKHARRFSRTLRQSRF